MTDDAEILHPDLDLEMAGRSVTVREFRFKDGMEIGPLIVALVKDLDGAVGDGSDLSGLFDTLYAHPDVLRHLLLKSTGQDTEWLDSLSGQEGDQLLMAFWSVNGPFFVRRLLFRRQAAKSSRPLETST